MEGINKKVQEMLELKKKRYEEGLSNDNNEQLALELVSDSLDITMFRNERNLMLFPFCSTGKKKRTKAIEYRSANGKYLRVTANATHGMAKIWDFDILRFALSKAGEIELKSSHFPSYVEFTSYEVLKHLNKSIHSGENYNWIKSALRRMAFTSYEGNIFETLAESGFNLFTYEYTEKNKQIDKIRLYFSEQLLRSIRFDKGLLSIDKKTINEPSGIKKRLRELVKVSAGKRGYWKVYLTNLQSMCAHEGRMNNFKKIISSLNSDNTFPWGVQFENTTAKKELVHFTENKIKL